MQHRSLIAIYYILFLDTFGYVLGFSIFPTLMLDPSFGFLPEITSEIGRNISLGALLVAFPLAQLFGAPFFGACADSYGRKKILAWTLTGTIFGYVLTAVAVMTKLYSFIIVSRVLTGFFGANLTICMAVLADTHSSKKERAKAFSLITAFLGLGGIAAIAIAPLFLFTPSTSLWMIAIFGCTSLFALWKFFEETAIRKESMQRNKIFHSKQLSMLYVMLFFWFFGFFISLQWAAPIAIEKYSATASEIVWFFVIVSISWALASGLLNRWLIEHSSLWKIMLWSLFLVSLFYFFESVSSFYFYFTTSYIISAIFAALAWGNTMTLISLTSSAEDQGKSLGMGQSMLALGQVLGPLIGGLIAGVSIKLVFFVCSFFVLVSFLLLLVYVIRRKSGMLEN